VTGINRVLALALVGDEHGVEPSANPTPPKYPGYGKRIGVKQAQRRADKRRNILRSKGHFKRAVR